MAFNILITCALILLSVLSKSAISKGLAEIQNADKLNIAFGTAFFYNSEGEMFTNRHVIESCDPNSVVVKTHDGKLNKAKILAKSHEYDLAAIKISYKNDAFGAIRTVDEKHVSVPEETEDVFSSGYSSPLERKFEPYTRWGQIQRWLSPNEFPYINRMRMDAYPGASGSAILDYAGLVVGILFAGSREPVVDLSQLHRAGYGDKWIFLHNNNAIVDFSNSNNLRINVWSHWSRKSPIFIAGHALRITGLVVCETAKSE
ncbi:serine protease [Thauera mechernichensis]|uniref:Serine protease n=1 Tax=Thauera mechernichensis TaxID=82788 RepID=A0ABW3W9R0_9RHOO|nr:serine protease [Thauera mechernichensis]MDG3066586.1 serine protease [Thauera mechernichensis]